MENTRSHTVLSYLKIFRLEHWFKNLLILPGAALAIKFMEPGWDWRATLAPIVGSLIPVCLLSSGNYIINEILDAPGDSLHPYKRHRPLAAGNVEARRAWFLATLCYAAAFAFSWHRHNAGFLTSLFLFFLVGGIAYNVPPLRLKEIAFLDVLAESANNPIRLLLGWYALTADPFSSWMILADYWAFGAFLMSAKRLSELRHLKGRQAAALYRHSFRHYSENRLLLLTAISGLACLALFYAVLIEHRVRAIPVLLLGVLFVLWVFFLVFRNSVFPREPEKIWKEPLFLMYVIFTGLVVLGLAVPGPWR